MKHEPHELIAQDSPPIIDSVASNIAELRESTTDGNEISIDTVMDGTEFECVRIRND